MPCDVDVLEADVSCIACRPAGTVQAMILVALCRISDALDMPCDFDQLEADASCIACRPPGTVQAMQLAALCNILAAIEGGGGGGGGLLCGAGAPVDPPSGTCGIYLDTDNDALYVYRLGAWSLKV